MGTQSSRGLTWKPKRRVSDRQRSRPEGRNKVNGVDNDEDGDFLVKGEYSASSNGIMLDSTTPRNVCGVGANNVYLRSLSGDSIHDGAVVEDAYEYDAYLF